MDEDKQQEEQIDEMELKYESENSTHQGYDKDNEPHQKISTLRQQFYIWFLFFNHISAQWQTYLFVYLATGKDPYYNIQVDLGMSSGQYGLVTGTIFTLVNSIFGLLMGYLADRYNRKWILFITTISFTLMTLVSAFTHSFIQVVFPRIFFSFFMSACIPVSVSLINDYFEHDMRGRANSLFAFGIYLGGGLSSLTQILNEYLGWRHSIEIVCIVSIVWGIPLIFFKEPPRVEFLKSQVSVFLPSQSIKAQEKIKLNQNNTASDEYQNQPSTFRPYKVYTFKEKLKKIFKNKCFNYFIIASTLRFWGGFSIGFWSPTFFNDIYPDYTKEYSICNAVVVIVGGLTSSYIGGYVSDKYEEKYPRIKGQISGYGALVSTIFIVITYSLQLNFYISMTSLFMAYLTAEMWYGPCHAAVNRIFPSEFQGIAIAIFTLTGALAGAVATYLLGFFSDVFNIKENPPIVGYLITAFVLFSYCSCCPMFLLAAREYEKETKKKMMKQQKNQAIK